MSALSRIKAAPPRQKFTNAEDIRLRAIVLEYKETNEKIDWIRIARKMDNRTARQCRERFQNYLDPRLNKNRWTEDEDELLLKLVQKYGKKWSILTKFFDHRADVSIKNRFSSIESRMKHNILSKAALIIESDLPKKKKKNKKVNDKQVETETEKSTEDTELCPIPKLSDLLSKEVVNKRYEPVVFNSVGDRELLPPVTTFFADLSRINNSFNCNKRIIQ